MIIILIIAVVFTVAVVAKIIELDVRIGKASLGRNRELSNISSRIDTQSARLRMLEVKVLGITTPAKPVKRKYTKQHPRIRRTQ